MAKSKERIDDVAAADVNHPCLSQTPVKVTNAIQVDTEGRRARFGSPPPPPGASPSLILPTPGRTIAGSATELILSQDGPYLDVASEIYDAPLKPPVFEKDEVTPKDAIIKLRQWCFKFVSIRRPMEISNETALLSHWIIVCGNREMSNGTEKEAKKDATAGEEMWHSSYITERKSPRLLSTATGSLYELLGRPNTQISEEKMICGYCSPFQNSIPDNWTEVITAEGHRRGHLRSPDKFSAKKLRKELRDAKRRECERFFRDSSLGPSETNESRARKLPSSAEASHEDNSAVKLTPRSIPREVQQLQSSKLGNLTMVQAAILEGLDGRNFDSIDSATEQSVTSKEIAKEEEGNQRLVTPLRSSSRARNSVSEWWKVGSKSTEKMSGNKKTANSFQKASAVKRLAEETRTGSTSVTDKDTSLLDAEIQADTIEVQSKHNDTKGEQPWTNSIIEQKRKKRKEPASQNTSKQKESRVPAKKHKSIEHFFVRLSPTSNGNRNNLREKLHHEKQEQPEEEIKVTQVVAEEGEGISEDATTIMKKDDIIEPPVSTSDNTAITESLSCRTADDTTEVEINSGVIDAVDQLRFSMIQEVIDDSFYFSD